MEDIFKQLGLKFNPFPIATDIRYYFWTARNKAIIEELYHGIVTKKGFMVLIGEAGLGKTSLSLQLLSKLEQEKIPTAWIFNTILEQEELFSAILNDFGLPKQTTISSMQSTLHDFFLTQHKRGITSVILIDEAQNLNFKCLESLRMLSNLEWEGEKLVQIVLVAQPEFKEILNRPKLRQLRSRIVIFLELSPFTLGEIKEYVNFKLISAQAPIKVKDSALKLLFKVSEGNTRLINLIMERCCYGLFVSNKNMIDKSIMLNAIRDVSNFQRDIDLRLKKIKTKKFLIISCLLSVILGFILGIVFLKYTGLNKYGLSFNTFLHLNTTKTISENIIKKNSNIIKTDNNMNNNKIVFSELKKDINLFLEPLGLEKLFPVLYQSIQEKNINLFKKSIPDNFVILFFNSNLTYLKNKNNYSIFPLGKYIYGYKWLVLWKPTFFISKKQNSKDKSDVFQLILKKDKNSSYKVIALTQKEVKSFQKKYNLPVTGKIDLKTLFFIEQNGKF